MIRPRSSGLFLQPLPQSRRVLYDVALFVLEDGPASLALVATDFPALGRSVLVIGLRYFLVTGDLLEGGALRDATENFLEGRTSTLGAFESVMKLPTHIASPASKAERSVAASA